MATSSNGHLRLEQLRGFGAWPTQNLIANHIEVLVPKPEVRFQVVAFGPFVPRFHKHETILERPIGHK